MFQFQRRDGDAAEGASELEQATATEGPATSAQFELGQVMPAPLSAITGAFGHWAAPPIQLNPRAPQQPAGRVPPLPLLDPDSLRRQADRLSAEELLTGDNLEAGHLRAVEAMDLLLRIPPEKRGDVIDQMDPAAFENLLSRVPEQQREHLGGLIEAANDPERRLKLWAQSHKSRVKNDVSRLEGDTGERGSRTTEQKENRRRHKRRRKAAKETHKEVDRETEHLLELAKKGKLDTWAVDALRQRKALEYDIERRHNLNLTNQTTPSDDGSQVVWSYDELRKVEATLDRLPDDHVHNKKGFRDLARIEGSGTTGGVHVGDRIKITDRGTNNAHSFRHGGDRREMAPKKIRDEHGENISTLEFVLTHEIGHDVDETHPEAFEKFKAAAGWETVDEKTLAKRGLRKWQIDGMNDDRKKPASGRIDIDEGEHTYKSAGAKNQFLARDSEAIPDHWTWGYAETNPAEHFAETYAKAVHVPEKLYADLVEKPRQRVARARAELARYRRLMGERKRGGHEPMPTGAELDGMAADVAKRERELARAQRAMRSRSQQFNVMRNDVFGTDKAAAAAASRLSARGASPEAIQAFQARAAGASTPEQVSVLEGEVK
jgi:hypothetical protein